MNDIPIGKNADGRTVFITPQMRKDTHMHIIGGSGKGKSKFMEWLIRQDIGEGHGLCIVDWHGTLYQDVLSYCAEMDVGVDKDFRKLVLINPSQPDFIVGFNPFMNLGADVSVQVRNRVDATIRPWGVSDTNAMPTFEYITTLLYTFAVEQQQTLANSSLLLDFTQPELREYAIQVLETQRSKQGWRRLQMLKNFRDWDAMVLSTENRIGRFLGSKAIRRFMGLTSGNISLRQIMDEGHIVLVNLGSSQYLDREAAKVFASLLLTEFFETAMVRAVEFRKRGEEPPEFLLYLDEFQEYITDDMAKMLDEVRKGGLHMVLAHQHLGHMADNPKLQKSIFTNARIRAVLGGVDYEDACKLANEMFLPDLNERQIKKAYYHTIHLYEEETRLVRSESRGEGFSETKNWTDSRGLSTSRARGRSASAGSGSSSGSSSAFATGTSVGTSFSAPGPRSSPNRTEGWFTDSDSVSDSVTHGTSESSSHSSSEGMFEMSSETRSESSSEGAAVGSSRSHSKGKTVVPVWVPIPVQELGSESEWSREEKVSRVAEMLSCQMKQHCFIKLDEIKTQPLWIPTVRDYSYLREYLPEYEHEVALAHGAIPAAEVDQLIAQSERRFLQGVRETIDITPLEASTVIDVSRDRGKAKRRGSASKALFATIKGPAQSPVD